MIDAKAEFYNSIRREFSGGTIQTPDRRSTTLQDIYTRIDAEEISEALELIPKLGEIEFEQNRAEIAEAAGVRPAVLDKL